MDIHITRKDKHAFEIVKKFKGLNNSSIVIRSSCYNGAVEDYTRGGNAVRFSNAQLLMLAISENIHE